MGASSAVICSALAALVKTSDMSKTSIPVNLCITQSSTKKAGVT
jgi:hypothetical protein